MMNKIEKVKTALLNQALRDPREFEFTSARGELVVMTHKETGAEMLVNHHNPICVMGCGMDLWADRQGIHRLEPEKDYIDAWSAFQEEKRLRKEFKS